MDELLEMVGCCVAKLFYFIDLLLMARTSECLFQSTNERKHVDVDRAEYQKEGDDFPKIFSELRKPMHCVVDQFKDSVFKFYN